MLPRLRCKSSTLSSFEAAGKEATFGWKILYVWLAILALGLSGGVSAQHGDPNLDAIDAGADWLLTQQTAEGWYPWEVGGDFTDEVQGAIARGMLEAYVQLSDQAYLDSALASGDYLIQTYPRQFADGDPDIHPLDVLFLHELSRITGDPAYANFIRANLWGKLRLGIYGENNDQDVQAWANTIPVLDDYDFYVSMEPLFRVLPAIAAYYAAEPEMSDRLMQSAIEKFEATTATSDTKGDLPAIGAAILASVHTGFNLDPIIGRFAGFDTTQDFVDFMIGFQRPSGDWPPHTGNEPGFVGDVSTTSWAVIGLRAWNTVRYQAEIDNGNDFIRSLQQPDGQILTNPGWAPTTVTGVQVHAEALVALGTDDGILLDIVLEPVNQAPVAVDDSASTSVDSAVNIDVLANDSDVDGALDPASVQIAGLATNGTASVDPGSGMVAYTPDPGFSGSDSFEYSVADDRGVRSYIARVSVTVSGGEVVSTPIADAYVSASEPGTNFGTASDLRYRRQAGNHLLTYVKFDVNAQGETIEGATLRLRLTTPSGGSGTLYTASNNYAGSSTPWTEPGLTWQNADRATGYALTTISLDTPRWIEIDVSNTVVGEGPLSFAFINTSSSLGAFSSREGAFPPELVLRVTDPTPPDVTPPSVTITSPTSQATFTTESATISLGGSASDDTGVDSVTWVNDRGGSGTASGTDNWSVASIALQPGSNQITVTATDAAGNSSSDVLTVTYDAPDATPPTVTITSPTSQATFTTESATVSLGGSASDDTGVDSVTWVNDRGGSGTASGTDNWSVASIALQPGSNQITVTATDAAGNSSSDVLTVTYDAPDATPPTVTITSPTSQATFTTESATVSLGGSASDDTGVDSVTWVNDRGGSGTASGTDNWSVASIALQPGSNQITVTATDAAGNSSSDVLTVTYDAPDATPPTVTITSPTSQATFTTESATVSLGGSASDDTGVDSVTWVNDRGGSGTASGTDNWSVASIALQPGSNQITVTATDAAGNSSSDVLTVTRETPNQPPVATITAPANGASFSVGQPIDYAGTGTDSEDGTLPASAFTWQAARVGGPFFPLAQGVTSETAAAGVPGTFIIRLTVEDSEGLTHIDEVTVTVQ